MTVLLSELLDRPVRGDSGWTHGSIHDVRIDRSSGKATVMALLVGRSALRERLFGTTSVDERGIQGPGFEVAWSQVLAIEPDVIRIKEAK